MPDILLRFLKGCILVWNSTKAVTLCQKYFLEKWVIEGYNKINKPNTFRSEDFEM